MVFELLLKLCNVYHSLWILRRLPNRNHNLIGLLFEIRNCNKDIGLLSRNFRGGFLLELRSLLEWKGFLGKKNLFLGLLKHLKRDECLMDIIWLSMWFLGNLFFLLNLFDGINILGIWIWNLWIMK